MPKRTDRHPKVLVAMGLGYSYVRDAIAGVISYARLHGPWEFVGEMAAIATTAIVEQTPEFDGVIFSNVNPEFADAIRRRGAAAVSIGSSYQIDGIPHVTADSEAVAKMAYTYLNELGFKHYAIYGGGESWRMERFQPFCDLVTRNGHVLHDLCAGGTGHESDEKSGRWTRNIERLKTRLPQLRERTAVFAWSSETARTVIAACDEAGIPVPDHIAVLGVDDDEAICELANPPISAIDHGCETIGWEAARILDALMHGEALKETAVRVDPVRIVTRQSTNTLAIDDELVVEGLRFIRQNFAESITADDVIRQLGVSRPTIEKHFRRHLGRTVHQQLTLTRVEHAKQLLHTPMLSMAAISVRCGFSYPSKFSSIFRRETGMSPQTYREQHLIRRSI